MKQILIIVGIILPLLLFGGCQTEQKTEAQNEFEHDLMGLYADVQAITSQAQTRSLDGEWIPPTEEELELIFAEIARIAEENGIAEQVLASGYYQNLETLNLAEMDMYEVLQWFETNGTPEFYAMVLEAGEETLDVEQIIDNPNLLPNEKLGLIAGRGVFTYDKGTGGLGGITIGGGEDTDPNPISDEQLELCLNQYHADVGLCKMRAAYGYLYTVIVIATAKKFSDIVVSFAGTFFGFVYGDCVGRSDMAFMICIE